MRMRSAIVISLLFLCSSWMLFAQADRSSDLFKTLKACDSLLFDIGYNTCNIQMFEDFVADDFEFYHDQGGITNSKVAFVASIRDGLCKMDYTPRRELDDASMEVFPLYSNGVLYGAIQNAVHSFYAIEKGKPEYITSTARFTHLWLLQDGEWKLIRGLSYDHVAKDD